MGIRTGILWVMTCLKAIWPITTFSKTSMTTVIYTETDNFAVYHVHVKFVIRRMNTVKINKSVLPITGLYEIESETS